MITDTIYFYGHAPACPTCLYRDGRLAQHGHVNPCRLVDGQKHETPVLSGDGERCDRFALSESVLP
jgi:hypothetical protein